MVWQGGLWKLLPRRAAAAGAGLRAGAAPPGTAPLAEQVGAALRKPRQQKDKGAARSGGRQGRKDRERAGCDARYAIYRFISPGYTEGKQRTAIEGL